MGCQFLLQGIFPTQGLNLGLPYCRLSFYHLSYQGNPQGPIVFLNQPSLHPGQHLLFVDFSKIVSLTGETWCLIVILLCFSLLISDGEGDGTPLQYSCLEKSHGRRSLVGCSPWGHEESDTTEQLHFHFSLSCIGKGNGNPLQCSCLENPRVGGAWWAAVYGVAQSQTQLKWLSRAAAVWLVILSTFYYACEPSVCHFGKNAYSGPLPILTRCFFL